MQSAKIRFFTTGPGDTKWRVLCYLRWEQSKLQLSAQYGDLRFWPIWGEQKCAFSQFVPETSFGPFCVSYARGSVISKFGLNTPILDSDRFEGRKNLIFHNLSRRPQMLRFVLVTLRAAYPANMSCKLQFQISASLKSPKIRFLTTRPAKLKWCVLC